MQEVPYLSELVNATEAFVRKQLLSETSGHDWYHVDRVRRNACIIAQHEGADLEIVSVAALLHDIADHKFHNGDEQAGPVTAREFLNQQSTNQELIDHVVAIVEGISFGAQADVTSLEGQCVQDADRLDALGAIGIARCFAVGATFQRPMYDPNIPPFEWKTKAEYKELLKKSTSFNHFTEKVLKVKEMMRTKTGKQWAERRHAYLEEFMDRFLTEWDSKDFV